MPTVKKTASPAAKKKTASPATKKKTASPAAKKTAARKAAPADAPQKDHARRTDYGKDASAYFEQLAPPVRALADELRRIVRTAAPDAREALKWGMPVYSRDKMFCYITARGAYVSLGFYGNAASLGLKDPEGLLEGSNTMGHVKVRGPADLRPELFEQWVRQAADHVSAS
jgi:hypothetical protein